MLVSPIASLANTAVYFCVSHAACDALSRGGQRQSVARSRQRVGAESNQFKAPFCRGVPWQTPLSQVSLRQHASALFANRRGLRPVPRSVPLLFLVISSCQASLLRPRLVWHDRFIV